MAIQQSGFCSRQQFFHAGLAISQECGPQTHQDFLNAYAIPSGDMGTTLGKTGRKGRKAFSIISGNGTGWKPLVRFLGQSNANIFLGQEVFSTQDDIVDRSHALKKMGRASYWAPSRLTQKGGKSSGVLIAPLARLDTCLPPCGGDVVPHRVKCCYVRAGALGHVAIYSVYLHSGKGLGVDNCQILGQIGKHAKAHGLPYIAGGDWQICKDVLLASAFPAAMGAIVVASMDPGGTCTSSSGDSNIDYFLVDKRLRHAILSISTIDNAGFRPHRPVRLEIAAVPLIESHQVIKAHKKLPADPPFGPRLAPLDWDEVSGEVSDIIGNIDSHTVMPPDELHYPVVKDGSRDAVQECITNAYAVWLPQAEKEIINALSVDVEPSGRGGFSKIITTRQATKFDRKFPVGTDLSRAVRWAGDKLKHLYQAFSKYAQAGPAQHSLGAYRMMVQAHRAALVQKGSPFSRVDSVARNSWLKAIRKGAALLAVAAEASDQASFQDKAEKFTFHCEYWMLLADGRASDIEKLEIRDNSRAFFEWTDTAVANGGAIGHAWTRRSTPWQPVTTVCPDSGLPTTSISTFNALQADEWGGIWKEVSGCAAKEVDSFECFKVVARLPDMTVCDFIAASKSFKKFTDIRDGLHPRHFALLPIQAIAALLMILHAAEASGLCPQQVEEVIIALIDKAQGGLRPLGLLRSLVRVWGRTRRGLLVDWEHHNASQPFFAASRGRSALDAVWRRSFRAETGAAGQMVSAATLWDLKKCYEHVVHWRLASKAYEAAYPMALMRLSIKMARWARRVSRDGVVSRQVWPSQGIIAGLMSATYDLKAYLLQTLSSHAASHPEVHISFYIDDGGQDATGDSPDQVADTIVKSSIDLRDSLEQELQLPLATAKCLVVGSCQEVVASISRRLGDIGKSTPFGARDLGADFTCGKALSKLKKSTKQKRFAALTSRLRRTERLAKANKKAVRLFYAGALPSVTYGMEVTGASDRDILKLRAAAGRLNGITGRGRNKHIAWAVAVDYDPAPAVAVAPIVRYAKEVWMAAAHRPPTEAIPFKDVVLGFLEVLNSYVPGALWKKFVAGPASAAIASATRIGWRFGSPTVLVDMKGKQIDLTTISPDMLKPQLVEAYVNSSLSKGLSQILSGPAFVDVDMSPYFSQGVCLGPIQALFRSKSKLPGMLKPRLLASVAGGLWTKVDNVKAGLSEDDLCELCGLARDTPRHRCYECSASKHLWEILPAAWLREARSATVESDLLYLRCLAPDHASLLPEVGDSIHYFVGNDADSDVPFAFDPKDGDVFPDGSCLWPTVKKLARAGWAAVQVAKDGTLLKGVYGTVPREVPQTSLAAEYQGAKAVVDLAIDPITVRGDCDAVVSSLKAPCHNGRDFAMSGAFWRAVARHHGILHHMIASAWHTKAHRSISEVQDDPEELQRFRGNQLADLWAKKAAALHGISHIGAKEVLDQVDKVRRIAWHVARSLALWPTAYFPKQACAVRKRRVSKKHRHVLSWIGNAWRCSECCGLFHSVPQHGCPGFSKVISAICDQDRGHKLFATVIEGQGPLIFCDHCGAYSASRGRGLVYQCGPPNVYAPIALPRLRGGKHPTKNLHACKPWRIFPWSSGVQTFDSPIDGLPLDRQHGAQSFCVVDGNSINTSNSPANHSFVGDLAFVYGEDGSDLDEVHF